ncbi:MAG: efflux RND transporter periplasmic adaptor subunit [Desulfovibrio sp.]|jgi:HlyD family secretion protein|nr:efflux RND transporter periplasmic adaptor subunit [Desulfovibrio sp.]
MHLQSKHISLFLLCAVLCIGAVAWRMLTDRRAENLTLYGNVDIRQVELSFRVGGRIARVLVDEGDSVKQGQALAELDDDVLIRQRDRAFAELEGQRAALSRLVSGYREEEIAQARAAVNAAAAVAENAGINLKRVTAMRAGNAASQRDLDNARAAAKEAGANLRSARDKLEMLSSGYRTEEVQAQRAAVAAAEAALELAEIHLRDAVLYAPQNAIVLTRAREAGSIVEAGGTVYTLALTDPTWLRAYVDEPQLGLIKPGMVVRVMVDAAPGRVFTGKVGFVSPTAEFTPKSVETDEVRTALVFRLRIQVEDPDNLMRQGMPVTVSVPLQNDR